MSACHHTKIRARNFDLDAGDRNFMKAEDIRTQEKQPGLIMFQRHEMHKAPAITAWRPIEPSALPHHSTSGNRGRDLPSDPRYARVFGSTHGPVSGKITQV